MMHYIYVLNFSAQENPQHRYQVIQYSEMFLSFVYTRNVPMNNRRSKICITEYCL